MQATPAPGVPGSAVGVVDFASFRVLLDEPAIKPVLGYDDLAAAFAQLSRESAPRFAIGIFGGWGSGKTTLMREIDRRLAGDPEVFTVWFNAWRYERETDLIVPLLDELRDSLAERAAGAVGAEALRDRLRRVADRLGQASRALLAGARLKASIAGTGFELDGGAAMAAWRGSEAAQPVSLYYASFAGIREAIRDFVEDIENPARRIVVFIDDLDRCLPENALQVLESMKLFFDLSGFVFVVGLDRDVIERAIEARYARQAQAGEAAAVPSIVKGAEYVKKIFQVPYGLPRISADDLFAYFSSLLEAVPDEQRNHFHTVVWRHLAKSTEDVSVNPREIKRLLNAYTLQMKVLSAKLGLVNPDAVLALQVLAFRADWERFYQELTVDPELFTKTASDALLPPIPGGPPPSQSERLPHSLLDYLAGPGNALLTEPDLRPYLESAESIRSSTPDLVAAQKVVRDVQRQLQLLSSEHPNVPESKAVSDLLSSVGTLQSQLALRDSRLAAEATRRIQEIEATLSALTPSASTAPLVTPAGWAVELAPVATDLEGILRAMRREAASGGTTA